MNALRNQLMKFTAAIAVVLLTLPSVVHGAVDMFSLAGTPTEMGTIWGELNGDIVVSDMNSMYLQPAYSAGITDAMLIERSALFVSVAEQIAPHWLVQGRAVAQAAGVDEDLYLAYMDSYVRNRFLYPPVSGSAAMAAGDEFHECTSYTVSRDHAKDDAILFHKTRDSIDKTQAVAMSISTQNGINKFMSISHGSTLNALSMIVNDKGLCCSSDYPAQTGYDYPLPPSAPNQYRGAMGGAILRHIAETASTCAEALGIVQTFVNNGWYGPGSVGGNHMLFVDRYGDSLELCTNSQYVNYEYHTNDDVYTSRNPTASVWEDLRNANEVDFETFHNVSRISPVLNYQSVSGMTVEVDPDYPELLTCAWFALPAKHVAYPVFMGQNAVPMPLADGSAYALGKSTTYQPTLWKAMEHTMHAEKELLRQVVVDNINAGTPIAAVDKLLENWSRTQATALVGQSTGFIRDYYSDEPAGIRISNSPYTINAQEMDTAFAGFFYSPAGEANGGTLVKAGLKSFTLIGDHDYTRRSAADVPYSLRVQGGLYKVIGAMNVEAGNVEAGDFALAGG